MASNAEEKVCRFLRPILDRVPIGASVLDTEHQRELLVGLEWFIPEVLGEFHNERYPDFLDGFYPIEYCKSGEREAEFFGMCILIADQTLAPIHFRLQVSAVCDEVSWLECRLGERGEHGMIRLPYESLNKALQRLYNLEEKIDGIDWVYKVTFGERSFEQEVPAN